MKKIICIAVILCAVTANAVYIPKRSWVQLAHLAYQNNCPNPGYSFGDGGPVMRNLGYYDMIIGAGGTIIDSFIRQNPNGGVVPYFLTTTVYPPNPNGATPWTAVLNTGAVPWPFNDAFDDMPAMRTWGLSQGYTEPFPWLWSNSSTVTITGPVQDPNSPYVNQPTHITTQGGNYTMSFAWNTCRFKVRPDNENLADYLAWRGQTAKGSLPNFFGLMNDEALGIYNGQGLLNSTSLPAYLTSQTSSGNYTPWGFSAGFTQQQYMDSLHRGLMRVWQRVDSAAYANNYFYFRNYAAWFYMTDTANAFEPLTGSPSAYNAHYSPNDFEQAAYIGHKRIGLLLGEYSSLNASYNGNGRTWQYLKYVEKLVDSGVSSVVWCGPVYVNGSGFNGFTTTYDYDIAKYGKERAFRICYAWYLMAQHPTLTWWANQNNQATTQITPGDSIQQRRIVEFNIGQPLGKFTDLGARGSFVNHYYLHLKRRYTNAVVIFANENSLSFTYDLTADTSTYHCTGFYELKDDGTLDPTLRTSITLLDGDGRIMVPNTNQPTKIIYINNANTVTEGGQLSFLVNRNWTDSAVTIFYNTVDGTAVAPGDYVSELNGQLTMPTGFATGTIFIQTNTDALLEPTQTMGVHLSASTGGAFTTADATGSIADGTTPPSTTNEKKLKLKKE